MSLTGCSHSNFRRLTNQSSPTLSSDDTIGIMVWANFASGGAGTGRGFMGIGEALSGSTHCLICVASSTNTLQTTIRSNTTAVVNADATNASITSKWDAYHHYAWVCEGPHNGASRAWKAYIDGVVWDSGSFTSQTYTSTLDTVAIGDHFAAGAYIGDRFAYFAVFGVASVAAAETIIAAAQYTDPASISGVDHAWSLNNTAAAQTGGPTLVAQGTGATLDTDMPTLSAPPAQWAIACMM